MKIGIIGAGFTGLAAANRLLEKGHEVVIFEKDNKPGGLAIGYKEKNWDWTLEQHYHHWFTNDNSVLNLAKELGYEVLTKTPKSSFFIEGKAYQFDSPIAILSFPKLPIFDRLRMAVVFAFLFRFNPFWKPLEKVKITTTVPKLIGKKAYKMLWEPQLVNKMGEYADNISLVWFWARIKKRTTSLAYPKGGYLAFAEFLAQTIEKKGGVILYETELTEIKPGKNIVINVKNNTNQQNEYKFDKILVTLPTPLFLKMAPQLPENYKKKLQSLTGIGATNLVIRMSKKFMNDNTYWLSVCEKDSKIMVIVEHTNFMDKKNYNNEHIIYIGNYMKTSDPKFSMTKEELLSLYDPFLKKINPDYKKNIVGYEVFRAPFAQPLIPINYSRMIPSFSTPLPNIYLANMQQVYPWDRGTNYAVEKGEEVAHFITENS